MAVTVRIPAPLRKLTDGRSEVSAEAANVSELVKALEAAHPGLMERLCDETGQIRPFVNIFVNDEDVRFMKGADTPLKDGDAVSIVPAIAGGSERHELRFHLTFPQTSVTHPVLYEVVRRHDIVFNIRRADIVDGTGTMDLSLSGTHDQIEKTVADMVEMGVEVDPIERTVIE